MCLIHLFVYLFVYLLAAVPAGHSNTELSLELCVCTQVLCSRQCRLESRSATSAGSFGCWWNTFSIPLKSQMFTDASRFFLLDCCKENSWIVTIYSLIVVPLFLWELIFIVSFIHHLKLNGFISKHLTFCLFTSVSVYRKYYDNTLIQINLHPNRTL